MQNRLAEFYELKKKKLKKMACEAVNKNTYFQLFILITLSTTVQPAARQLQLRKFVSFCQTNNIIKATVGQTLTSGYCAVRCSRNSACDAYNYGVTSDGNRICEEVIEYQNSARMIVYEEGWSFYAGETIVLLLLKFE